MALSDELEKLFPPDENALVDWLRPQMSDAMLEEISIADNGFRQERALAMLQEIRSHGTYSRPMDSDLWEVLGTTCWSNPDRPNPPPFAPGPTAEDGHRIRLFASAVLMWHKDDPCDSFDSWLAIGLASAGVVGLEADRQLGRFLTWKIKAEGDARFRLLSKLALLLILVRRKEFGADLSLVEQLAEQVIDQEQQTLAQWRSWPTDPEPNDLSVQQGFWRKAIDAFKQQVREIESAELREKLELCALLVTPSY